MRALALILLSSLAFGQMSEPRALFRVKHVAEGAIYLDGGRSSGLSEGMKLTITRDTVVETTAEARAIAEVEIVAVAESSSVCSILASREPIRAGDAARLSPQDAETIQALKAVAGRSKYAQVVTFSDGDTILLDAEGDQIKLSLLVGKPAGN